MLLFLMNSLYCGDVVTPASTKETHLQVIQLVKQEAEKTFTELRSKDMSLFTTETICFGRCVGFKFQCGAGTHDGGLWRLSCIKRAACL